MVNLGILAIFVLILMLTRGRLEGTARMPGFFLGLGCTKVGRVRVGVVAYRPNRVYFRFSLAGG